MKKDVIIIGAGASGLFCGAECGKRGRSVLLLDHADRIGSKVLVSGGGRCNFTNLSVTADHYLSRNPDFCRSALARFTPRDIIFLLQKHGMTYSEKEAGQLFCATGSRDIVAMLRDECSRAGAELLLACSIDKVGKGRFFEVTTGRGTYFSESLVVATGGMSYPNLGATGYGYALARQFGLRVTELRPALVPFIFSGSAREMMRKLAGISLEAAVTAGDKRFRGRILFTHRGLSGPAVLQASAYWRKGAAIDIDLLPGTDAKALLLAENGSSRELRSLLGEYLPRRFARTWCDMHAQSRPLNRYSDRELRTIAAGLHSWPIIPAGTEGFPAAEVTAGGVDTEDISSKTMEAKNVPGLYFIGEVLDVTGQLGGYNLHWAWASGWAAGQFA